MPIRLRIAALIAGVSALIVTVAALAGLALVHASVLQTVDDALAAQAGPVSSQVLADGLAAPARTARLLQGSLETFGQVIAPDGTVAVASHTAGSASILPSHVRRALEEHGQVGFDGAGPPPHEGLLVRLLAVRVDRADGRYVIVVGSSIHTLDTAERRLMVTVVAGGAIAVALCAIGGWLVTGAALRPVERLRRAVAALSDQGLSAAESVPIPGTRDEIAALARTLNTLLERVSLARARERRLVADASHELRTPLTVLRMELELADRPGRTREELADAVTRASAEAARIARLADDLLLLARADGDQAFCRPVRQPVAPILAAAARRPTTHGITLTLDVTPPDVTAAVDADRIRQALDNLLDNALRVSPEQGRVAIRAVADDHNLIVTVRDEGPGFPDVLPPEAAFDRFRRADTARARDTGGTGLGLAIVRSIAVAHGGAADAVNNPTGGATVRLVLPIM
ncbi:sensor histidine kinase [Catenuloplanes japonicus]|uniref:sensor histidine kinase n=1 Tax=Catenuloplanes japonicus TaxID=33876 RepID=UPI0005261EAF|nr:HAMP domain-containing sensor histidine kinase [Catenuloplanes japonicus]